MHSSWVCILKILCPMAVPSCLSPSWLCGWEGGWRRVTAIPCTVQSGKRKEPEKPWSFYSFYSCCFLTSQFEAQLSRSPSCVSCLFFIRHSPKVIKAASQVLNSMWQYRDLRSLYKKVRFALPSCLVSCIQALSPKTPYLVLTRCVIGMKGPRLRIWAIETQLKQEINEEAKEKGH